MGGMSGPTLTPARSRRGKSQPLRGILYREKTWIFHINNISNRDVVFWNMVNLQHITESIAVVKRDSKPDLIGSTLKWGTNKGSLHIPTLALNVHILAKENFWSNFCHSREFWHFRADFWPHGHIYQIDNFELKIFLFGRIHIQHKCWWLAMQNM